MAYARNKKVNLNYEILDTFEAGVVLDGHEVKSVRAGHVTFEGSYISLRKGEAFLVSAGITPYQIANLPKEYDKERPRKLLLTQKQLRELAKQTESTGLTLIPVSLYNKGNKIKLEFALAKGKKKHDKREDLKKKEADREIKRSLKNR